MNGEIREPEPNDDDIPTLTDIVVPGRLPAGAATGAVDDAAPSPGGHTAPESESEFVFDVDFAATQASGEKHYDYRAQPLSARSEPEPAPALESAPAPRADEDGDLPLPWSAQHPPELAQVQSHAQAQVQTPPSAISPADPEPLIVAAQVKAAQAAAVAEAQALLRTRMDDIATSMEQRLQDELVQIELRLRAALREELDARFRELLASAPPTA